MLFSSALMEYLLFTHLTDIRRISLDDRCYHDVVLPLNNLKYAVGLDWHRTMRKMVWCDSTDAAIYTASLEVGTGLELVNVDYIPLSPPNYGTDHTQCRIHSHSRICLRLNNYREKKAWHLFRSRVSLKRTQRWMLARKTGATPFFLVIIKPQANPCA